MVKISSNVSLNLKFKQKFYYIYGLREIIINFLNIKFNIYHINIFSEHKEKF